MKEDTYIELLKWGKDNSNGVSYKEFTDKLKEFGFPHEGEGMVGSLNTFTKAAFSTMGNKFILNYNGYFQLLEHERLEEARIDSKNATTVATWSLWIAILTLIISMVLKA